LVSGNAYLLASQSKLPGNDVPASDIADKAFFFNSEMGNMPSGPVCMESRGRAKKHTRVQEVQSKYCRICLWLLGAIA
jgi:hypothetical protein